MAVLEKLALTEKADKIKVFNYFACTLMWRANTHTHTRTHTYHWTQPNTQTNTLVRQHSTQERHTTRSTPF